MLDRFFDVWGGLSAGVGVASFDGGGSAVGPHLGVACGADVHPLRFLSLGIAVRAGGVLLDVPNDGTSVRATATVGAVLGFHFGYGG